MRHSHHPRVSLLGVTFVETSLKKFYLVSTIQGTLKREAASFLFDDSSLKANEVLKVSVLSIVALSRYSIRIGDLLAALRKIPSVYEAAGSSPAGAIDDLVKGKYVKKVRLNTDDDGGEEVIEWDNRAYAEYTPEIIAAAIASHFPIANCGEEETKSRILQSISQS